MKRLRLAFVVQRYGLETDHIRAAGFSLPFASYTYCLVFPAVEAFRLAPRVTGTGAGSDVFPPLRAVTAPLGAIQALERALLRFAPLPCGSSVLCVAGHLTGAIP